MVTRLFVEKKPEFKSTQGLIDELKSQVGVNADGLRRFIRYDIEGLTKTELAAATAGVFAEPMVDRVFDTLPKGEPLIVEYLDGQYDQRADSAMQCVQLLLSGTRPLVKCADVYLFERLSATDREKVKRYLINPVDSKEGDSAVPKTLARAATTLGKMRVTQPLIQLDDAALKSYYEASSFAMTLSDLKFVRDYFKNEEKREPTLTEIKVIDTYWSDHCRHTTFLTELNDVKVLKGDYVADALSGYRAAFEVQYKGRTDKYPCLMDVATLAAKRLKAEGYLDDLDESEEINACSVSAVIDVDGKPEEWLLMFKNETHNHPTEIEPFGGAATCLGGAIRDPLSGRTYVYHAMRVTGSGDPTEPIENTLRGKLPQRTISKTALAGFSSYGNQIGLATGTVAEIYHERYRAKRLEAGYVVGAAKKENVVRKSPKAGDIVILVGGDTGRDGCGGATGSSKAHDESSVQTLGAEVQKGNPPEERKLQRLFRNPAASKLIVKCNDFGAGGVAVAIGELSAGLTISLDKISKKYEGLTATELAISESQERMAVVVEKQNAAAFIAYANQENLKAVVVAEVTDNNRLVMNYGDENIVSLSRAFLDTNGVKQVMSAEIEDTYNGFLDKPEQKTAELIAAGKTEDALKHELSRLNVCSKKGMGETFDSTIGANSVLMPFGGETQLTPSVIMAAKPPVSGETHTVTCSSFALYPDLMCESPYFGASYAVLSSVSKLISAGVPQSLIRLSLQEFFKRLHADPKRWGEPLSALLGAYTAQIGLKTAAIGGKDSMSGSFESLDVPPTLISFAFGRTDERCLVHNAFMGVGKLYRFAVQRNEKGLPDYEKTNAMFDTVTSLIGEKKIAHTTVVEDGGAAIAVIKACFGNLCGVSFVDSAKHLFAPRYGDIVALSRGEIDSPFAEYIGEVTDNGTVHILGAAVKLSALIPAFTEKLEGVYPTVAPASGEVKNLIDSRTAPKRASGASAGIKVLIPVFPGTNCEYDTARAFERYGATADIFVIKNANSNEIEESISELKKRIDAAQILAFPGGFSGGDEPDGSGKFIAATFRNPRLTDAVHNLLYKRDGLALGICNGFQALVKLGLLPNGYITEMREDCPTLTFNNISRHVSSIVRTRVATTRSPWLNLVNPGEVYSVPVSHGEGRFVADEKALSALIAGGQVATQYVDMQGNATMVSPFNPNGSMYAIEGIVSADGRILGKMGHTERCVPGLYENVPGNYDMPLIKAGVAYFK